MWSCSAEQLALHARDLDEGLSPSESWAPGFWFLYGTSYELLLLIMAFRNINLKMKYVKLLCPGLTSWKTLWPSLQWLRAGRSGEQIQTCERGNTPFQINIKILTMSFQMLSSSLSGFFLYMIRPYLTYHHTTTPQNIPEFRKTFFPTNHHMIWQQVLISPGWRPSHVITGASPRNFQNDWAYTYWKIRLLKPCHQQYLKGRFMHPLHHQGLPLSPRPHLPIPHPTRLHRCP